MIKYIKYKRFDEFIEYNDIQSFFDKLIENGWEIISYNENDTNMKNSIRIIVICGKKQEDIL